jgi:ATP-binding cassette subfamily B protein
MTGLDQSNEKAVLESLDRLDYGCTTFFITHDLQHAARADLILYLEGGQILERGTHSSLLRANGRYAGTYRLQIGGPEPYAKPAALTALGLSA